MTGLDDGPIVTLQKFDWRVLSVMKGDGHLCISLMRQQKMPDKCNTKQTEKRFPANFDGFHFLVIRNNW